ncbi:MAG: acyltransferase [Bauldia sp.]|nr:acyltransferase [Bauldia sp.]
MAVVPVVLFHANAPYITGGFVGVDVFFVISGFLIAGILKREVDSGSFSLLGFYERRARRILPALLAVIASTLVVGAILLLPEALFSLGRSAIAAILFISNYWALDSATDYFDTGITPLLHTWSLAVEEQFYLLFPILLAILTRWWHRCAWWIVAAICIASLVLSIVQVADENAAAFYLAPSRIWELGIGVLLAIAPLPVLRRRWQAEFLGIAGLIAIAAAMLLYTRSTPFPGGAALLPTLGAAAVIYGGNSIRTLATRLLAFPPVVFVGLISYSLYLWHWPILTFVRVRLTAAEFTIQPKLWAIAGSFLLAALTWRFIEQPFRRRTRLTRKQVFAASGVGGLAVATLAATVLVGDGFAGRLSREVQVIIADTEGDGRGCMGRPSDNLCEIGADVPPTVLLWGDSHASSAIPAFQDALLQAGVRAVAAVHPGCPPLVGVVQPSHATCDAFRAAIGQEILAHPEWTTIVLSARWPYWVNATGGPTPGLVLGEDFRDATTNAFEHGLRRAVEWLLGLGRRVLIVGPVPEPGWNVPEQMVAELRWSKPLPPVATMVGHNAFNETVFGTFSELEGMAGLTIMPVADLLCTPECAFALDGRPLYVDDNHLSRLGALHFLAPRLAAYPWR